jgi:serine O-acetyltransferase
MLYYRTAHELYLLGVPVIPRMLTEYAHSMTGIDIHPAAVIGDHFAIDHGTGVVIGETTIIGSHVTLYQGVTLGAKNFSYDTEGHPLRIPRHPILEDNVTVYSNASILGRITIGEGSVIGGNVWLTHSVPKHSRILQGKVQDLTFTDGAGI